MRVEEIKEHLFAIPTHHEGVMLSLYPSNVVTKYVGLVCGAATSCGKGAKHMYTR